MWQTFGDWECIVVNDTSQPLTIIYDERVRIINSLVNGIPLKKLNRAAVARNTGIKEARGEFVIFLDADDYLLRHAMELLLRAHLTHNRSYTYSSHYSHKTHLRPPDYEQAKYATFNIHPITALVPTGLVRDVGGFDDNAPGWEDWTLWLRLAIKGYCGQFCRGPIFVYRDEFSINHTIDVAGGQELMDKVIAPYKNKLGAVEMASCCGGGSRTNVRTAVSTMGAIPMQSNGMKILQYNGTMKGTFMLTHPTSKRQYRAGNNNTARYLSVPVEDIAYFLSFGTFVEVMPTLPYEEAPVVDIPPPIHINEIPVPALMVSVDEEVETPAQVMERPKRGRPKASE